MQRGFCWLQRRGRGKFISGPHCEYRKGIDYRSKILYYRDIGWRTKTARMLRREGVRFTVDES